MSNRNISEQGNHLSQPTLNPAPVHFIDERGYLLKFVRSTDISHFGELYLIGDWTSGIIRAFHKHEKMEEWFSVIKGSAKFVLFDDRPESPQHGVLRYYILSARRPELLYVPTGVYHGHMALENETQTLAVASQPYDPAKPDEVRASYDSFGVEWMAKPI